MSKTTKGKLKADTAKFTEGRARAREELAKIAQTNGMVITPQGLKLPRELEE